MAVFLIESVNAFNVDQGDSLMLKVKNVDLFYDDAQALFGVNLEIGKGDLAAIVGGNGAGKTSFIRTLSGIYKARSGQILFEERDVTGLDSHGIAELGIGHVAEGRQVFPHMTILENLQVGGSLKRSKSRMNDNLDYVFNLFPKLKEREKQFAGTLSGGEQQMLAIGRCLMAQPSLILFDEPSLGLSPIMVQEMFRMIVRLHQMGLTIVLVEQNVVASLEIASKAFVLENGQVTLSGNASDLIHHEGVKKAYLGL